MHLSSVSGFVIFMLPLDISLGLYLLHCHWFPDVQDQTQYSVTVAVSIVYHCT